MADVELREIQAGFDGRAVLDEVNLTVPGGSIMAVLGPSGCGKTTLLRIIAGFHQPFKGEVWVDGHVVASPRHYDKPERRGIGIVPQEGALFPHLSVAGNVGFGLGSQRNSRERVGEILELVGLSGFGSRMPQELSGGQQQRVALARALAPEPKFILLDEPFSSLDAGLRTELREDVVHVLRHSGATTMMVTHDQAEAMSMADLVAVMRDGKIAQVGDPREVYAHPTDLDIALMLGEAIVLDMSTSQRIRCCGIDLDGTVGPTNGRRLDAAWNDGIGAHNTGEGAVGKNRSARSPVAILRTEQVRVRSATEATREPPNAVVTDVYFYGQDAAILLEPYDRTGSTILSDRGRLRARVPGTTLLSPGSEVRVDVDGPASLLGGRGTVQWHNGATSSTVPMGLP